MRGALSLLFLLAGITCLTLAVWPSSSTRIDAENGDKVHESRAGFAFSPLYLHTHREPKNAGFRKEWGLHVFSWSMLVLVVGFVCVRIAYAIYKWKSVRAVPQ